MNTAARPDSPPARRGPRAVLAAKLRSCDQPARDGEEEETMEELLPLPDVVLCSALSANILHGRRIRERRRHKAAVQTRGREHLEDTEVDAMMEPLVRSLEGLLADPAVSLHPAAGEEEADGACCYHGKRRRTISTTSTATASKLSTLSTAVLSSNLSKVKKGSLTIEDTPEGVFNGLKNLFKNVFAN
jgi:hypothetical protein